jgi:hypothetical protein
LQNLADSVLAENSSPDMAVFGITPSQAESREISTTLNSQNYKVNISWPEQVFPSTPVPLALFFSDANGNRIPNATYDLILMKDEQTILNRNGVSTGEGFASHDVIFDSQGTITVVVDKIDGSDESVAMTINVVPEFPLGLLLSITIAFGLYVALYRRSKISNVR